MENSELKERLLQFIAYKGMSIRAFEESCGLCNGFVSKVLKTIGSDKLMRILNTYPEINVFWLADGNGAMLQEPNKHAAITIEYLVHERDDERVRHDEAMKQLVDQNSELIKQNKVLTDLLRISMEPKA